MATTQEKLTSVEAAIAAIEGGAQAYTSEGLAVQRADLKILYVRQQHLEQVLARETRGSALRYGVPVRG